MVISGRYPIRRHHQCNYCSWCNVHTMSLNLPYSAPCRVAGWWLVWTRGLGHCADWAFGQSDWIL